jgi:hypothetical protein
VSEHPKVLKRTAALLVVISCGITLAAAEDAPFAEYRLVKEIGQIQISAGSMERTDSLQLSSLEKNGIVVLETDVDRNFQKTEKAGGHKIETTIAIATPVGHGEGGASSFTHLKILIDGKARVDCPFWNGFMGIDRIAVDVNSGFIWLIGYERLLHFEGFESRNLIDQDWLEQHANSVKRMIREEK